MENYHTPLLIKLHLGLSLAIAIIYILKKKLKKKKKTFSFFKDGCTGQTWQGVDGVLFEMASIEHLTLVPTHFNPKLFCAQWVTNIPYWLLGMLETRGARKSNIPQ